jgi:putative endonuclease
VNQEIGQSGEALAAKYLEKIGMQLIAQNFRIGRYEIDILMRDQEQLVFVEVKTAASDAFGDPLEAIDHHKTANLLSAAGQYLASHPGEESIRIDIVTIKINAAGIKLNHYPNSIP